MRCSGYIRLLVWLWIILISEKDLPSGASSDLGAGFVPFLSYQEVNRRWTYERRKTAVNPDADYVSVACR